MNQTQSMQTMPTVEFFNATWGKAMQTMNIVPVAPALPQLIGHPIIEQHNRVMLLSEQQQLDLAFLGYAPLFTNTHLYKGDATDWAVMNLSDDAVYYTNGNRLILPEANKTHITRIREAGLDFEAVYIAHELPKGSVREGEAIPVELIAPPPPPEATRRAGQMSKTASGLWSGVNLALRGALKTTKAAALTVGTVSVGALALTAGIGGLDPVLFGVNKVDSWNVAGQPMGMWYYLTHWWWPPQEG